MDMYTIYNVIIIRVVKNMRLMELSSSLCQAFTLFFLSQN